MKSKIIISSLILGTMFFSCKESALTPPPASNLKVVQFLNEKVNFPSEISKSDIDIYLSNLNSSKGNGNAKIAGDIDLQNIPLEKLYGFIKLSMAKNLKIMKIRIYRNFKR